MTDLDQGLIERAAADLLDMRRTGRVVASLPDEACPPDLATAYAIQDVVVGALTADAHIDGASPIGYKVACTSEIAQQALQINRPVYGQLLAHTTETSGATLRTNGFVHRVVEAEFGFRLGRDVGPGPHTHESIAGYIDAVIPAIEIVDHRFESWAVGALQVAADNAIHGWWVHGEPMTAWRDLELDEVAVSVSVDGEIITTGSGAAVLGHPLTVMAWLAEELATMGRQLKAGDLVTTGVTTDVFEAVGGNHVVAAFDGIGSVELRFD